MKMVRIVVLVLAGIIGAIITVVALGLVVTGDDLERGEEYEGS